MSELAGKIAATPPPPTLPTKDEPRFEYEWDGSRGYIQTGALTDRPRTWDEFIRDAGLDPEEVEVLEPVNVRGWDAAARLEDGTTGTVRHHYYKLNVRRRSLAVDIDELVKVAKRRVTNRTQVTSSDHAFVVALGDLQLGKVDGDGVEGTVQRFIDTTKAAIKRYRRVAKGAPVYLIHLGDCIEGYVSQGGANAWRTTLTTTEQVRRYRRLLMEQVKAFAAVAPELTVCGIPGNHDEAHRPLHTYGDSWAIEAVSMVMDACELAGGYDHVKFYAPARDELTLTLDVCGTTIGMAHGHQFGSGIDGWRKWWQGQQHGRHDIGHADILLAAHRHHLRVEQGSRTFVQVPALESESTWFRHKTGEVAPPGIVTMIVGGGAWHGLEVL